MTSFTLIADLQGRLLESPVWDARRGSLFLCDITGGLIHEIGLDGAARNRWSFDDQVASLGLGDSGRLVVALARQVILLDPDTGRQEVLATGFDDPASSRLNDGKVGPDGAFWVGSADMRAEKQPISKLYRVTPGGITIALDGGLRIANGLAWTGDGRGMFLSDSRGPWVDRFDFDPQDGKLSNRRRWLNLSAEIGRPDGGACDREDHYWSAGVSAGVLNRFAPDGRLDRQLRLPVPAPTMPCFCGPDLEMIAVTSHREDNQHPGSGGVLLGKAPVPGVAVARMAGV